MSERAAAGNPAVVPIEFRRVKNARPSRRPTTRCRTRIHKGSHVFLFQNRCGFLSPRVCRLGGLLGFVLAGFALAGSPGPATLSLAATGAAFGARRGLGYMAGIVIGMIMVICIIATGVTGVMLALPARRPS